MSNAPSTRRQWVGVVVGLVIVVVNYGLHRAGPRLQQMREHEAQAAKAEASRTSLSKTVQPARTRVLAAQVASLRQDLAAREATLTAGRRRLAPPDQAGELAVQVAALAREVGLRVETEEANPPTRPTAPTKAKPTPAPVRAGDLGKLLQTEAFGRSLRTWTVSGGFLGLQQFMQRLETLPFQVLVVRLSVERPSHLERYDPPLKITMTVAL